MSKRKKKRESIMLSSGQQINVARKWLKPIFYPLIALCHPLVLLFRQLWRFLNRQVFRYWQEKGGLNGIMKDIGK